MKVITTVSNGINTEHYGQTFNDVYNEVKNTGCDIYLERHDEDIKTIGWKYIGTAKIGNSNDILTREDYLNAYDKLF